MMMLFKSDWKYSINAKTFNGLDVDLFRNFRFGTLFNYIFVTWGLMILKFALLVSDVYTCIKLLAFNSWSNNIVKPYLPFAISKWLLSGCILASIALLIWETIVGIGIYRSRNISLTYINNFARTAYSLSNYSIFCVLDRITPKGSYQRISFFTFFELKDCVRLLFTDTPRQVVNGLTLWSVLITASSGSDLGDLESFNGLITKIKIIAKTNHEEAVVLSFMLFSFIIWLFFITKLALAMLFSTYVYYRLINERKYNGLKEFVCVTISHRVDAIVEKQKSSRNKKQGPDPYGKLQTKSTTSFFPMEDLEFCGGANFSNGTLSNVSLPDAFKNSTTALLEDQYRNNDSRLSSSSSDNNEAKILEEKNQLNYDATVEPVKMTSAIDTNYKFKPKWGETNIVGLEDHETSTTEKVLSTSSSETLPSYHLNQPISHEGLNRPRPPMIQTFSRNLEPGQQDDRINTPLRAYTRESIERSASLLDRREQIANENYSHFIHMHRK